MLLVRPEEGAGQDDALAKAVLRDQVLDVLPGAPPWGSDERQPGGAGGQVGLSPALEKEVEALLIGIKPSHEDEETCLGRDAVTVVPEPVLDPE